MKMTAKPWRSPLRVVRNPQYNIRNETPMKSIDSADTFGGQLACCAAPHASPNRGAGRRLQPADDAGERPRAPTLSVVAALFIAALGLKVGEPTAVRLLQAARQTQATPNPAPTQSQISKSSMWSSDMSCGSAKKSACSKTSPSCLIISPIAPML